MAEKDELSDLLLSREHGRTTLSKRIKHAVRNWWIHVIAGILFIIMAIWVVATPMAGYIGLSIFFSTLMLVSGFFEILFALANRGIIDNWGWYFAAALVDFAIGLILAVYPGITMIVLPLLVAFWLMFKGFSAIGIALDLRHYQTKLWIWLLIAGILSVLFSILIIANPLVGGISIAYLTGLSLITIGVFRIVLGYKLRKLHEMLHQKRNDVLTPV